MAAQGERIAPRTRGRSGRPALAALLIALVFASACAPRAVPVASTQAPEAPRRSPGCTAATAAPSPARLVVAGAERAFLARVPDGPTTVPRDLVLAFHGRTNDAAQFRRYSGLDEALPEAIVVYPRALPAGPGAFAWAAPRDPPGRPRDVAFVEVLIDAFGRDHCLDLDRVFVVGHSLGAYFANDVACRLGDRIRAVASVAGGLGDRVRAEASVAGGLRGDGCVGGAAALLIHHPNDRLVPVGEGARARDAYLRANGLGAEPGEPVATGPLASLRCARHGDATATDPVLWCARDDGTTPRGLDPHTWPIDAADAIAAFFASLP